MMSQSKQRIAFFTALCMFFSLVEFSIPKPSFLRIGFSNIPIMLAIFCSMSFPDFLLLSFSRILTQALINGTLLSYAFVLSLSSGLVSSLVMFLIGRKRKHISFISVSVIGAFAGNCAQIFASSLFLGKGVFSLSPIILGFGVLSSFLLGLFTNFYCSSSKVMTLLQTPDFEFSSPAVSVKNYARTSLVKTLLFLLIILVLFLSESYIISFCCCIASVVLCLICKKRIRILPGLALLLTAVFVSLLQPSGKVLLEIGAWKITLNSLELGLRRGFVMLTTFYSSRFMMTAPQKTNTVAGLAVFYFGKISEAWNSSSFSGWKDLPKRIDTTVQKVLTDFHVKD